MSTATDRTRVRRMADRGVYDLEQIKAILDANQVCHAAYVENGEPRIIPTLYMRRGEHVYLHGNRQAALLRHLGSADEHEDVLDAFVRTLVPGHEKRVRRATRQELKATPVGRIPIDEASAKIRSGPPIDAEGDLNSDVWAGVIPLISQVLDPISAPDLKAGIEVPDYIRDYPGRH